MTRFRGGLALALATALAIARPGNVCHAQADSTVYLPVQPGIQSSNGARFWPALAGTRFPTVMTIYPSVPAAGVDYYSYSSPGGVIPWSNGTLGNAQFVVYHPSNGTYWIAQAFSTSGSNVAGSGGGIAVAGYGMVGSGTPVAFCGGGGRQTPIYWEIVILSQIQPPATTLSASAGSVVLGQSVRLTATTTSPSATLYAQAIDYSPDGATWASGTTVAGANWSGGPASQHSLAWSFSPTSVGTWYFRAAGTDSVGISNSATATVSVARAGQSISSSNASITFGQSFAPAETGGAGTYEFCVAGDTNWDWNTAPWVAATDANAGTNLGSAASPDWVPTWTPGLAGAPSPTNTAVAGTYLFWVGNEGSATVSPALAPGSSGGTYALTVNKATPVGSFHGRMFTYGTTLSGILNATFANPYSSAVTQPTGATTYSASGYGPVSAGTVLPGGTYVVTASYPGDANYNPATAAATFTVGPEFQAPVTITPTLASLTTGQSAVFTASGGSGTGSYGWGGSGSGVGASQTITFNSTGEFTVTVARAADTNFIQSNTATATVWVNAPAPPTGTIQASPGSGTVPLSATVTWATTGATSAVVAGNGLASSGLSGSQNVTLTSAGSYTYTLTAGGPGGQVTRSAALTASEPMYALTTYANGNGSVTPGGTYPAGSLVTLTATPGSNASFSGWTGSLGGASDPLLVTMSGAMSLVANFVSMQPQTITFSTPAKAGYPSPAIALAASASSGLPVGFSLVSGPATLSGNQLTLTGPGAVVVQATQAGNSLWLPAVPVNASVQVNPTAVISRIRFNATGSDAHVLGGGASSGSAFIWTDSTGIQASPWPSFGSAQPASTVQQNTALPAVPVAP